MELNVDFNHPTTPFWLPSSSSSSNGTGSTLEAAGIYFTGGASFSLSVHKFIHSIY